MGYSLQANAKVREGRQHPDRDRQFRHINDMVKTAIDRGQPVISVDTKKKELVGDFKNGGRELRPKGSPVPVRVHDFKDKELGKAIPYGIYDLADDTGWVSVGIDHDTAQFAVASIRGWWEHLGRQRYPDASTLTITADCGGSNGNRTRLWKTELQRLADETGLEICVCHFPPGTSKWNKIEHRLFSFITQNWRAKPLETLEVIINLIAATTTRTGLEVYARLTNAPTPTRSRSPTPRSPRSPSPAISSTPNGTTPSTRDLLNDDPLDQLLLRRPHLQEEAHPDLRCERVFPYDCRGCVDNRRRGRA